MVTKRELYCLLGAVGFLMGGAKRQGAAGGLEAGPYERVVRVFTVELT
jgi:hypothetical protein